MHSIRLRYENIVVLVNFNKIWDQFTYWTWNIKTSKYEKILNLDFSPSNMNALERSFRDIENWASYLWFLTKFWFMIVRMAHYQ